MARRRGNLPSSMTRSAGRSRGRSRAVRSRRSTAWSVGGRSIWRSGYSRSSASRSPGRRSAGSYAPWAIVNYRLGHATMRKPKVRSILLKKPPRAPGGSRAREGRRRRQDRNLVPGRGSYWPEEQGHPPVGKARYTPKRSPRSAHSLHLHLRRRLSQRWQRSRSDPAGLQ